jgi:predicted DNA-binding protein YlxM (UPF0122 family)
MGDRLAPKWVTGLRRNTQLFKNPDFLRQKYVEEKLSIAEIAALTMSSNGAVHSHLKSCGIETRRSGENIRPKRHLSYGYKISCRDVVNHAREQETLKKMQELRNQGFSYWKIADILNTMKVPTKTRKGRWHARSVQQIMDAEEDRNELEKKTGCD